MKKLFANVGGNQFRLLTENIDKNTSLIRSGLRKVFSAGSDELSYKRVQNVGLGYIKSPSDAAKAALQEAREIASEYGYVDNPGVSKFVKEEGHGEGDMSNPEEKREVQIAKEILKLVNYGGGIDCPGEASDAFAKIENLAKELMALHTGQAVTKPGTGGASYKPGSIY